jgi:hypothetical protein
MKVTFYFRNSSLINFCVPLHRYAGTESGDEPKDLLEGRTAQPFGRSQRK